VRGMHLYLVITIHCMPAQEAVKLAREEAAASGLTGKELAKHDRKLRIAAGKARARQCVSDGPT